MAGIIANWLYRQQGVGRWGDFLCGGCQHDDATRVFRQVPGTCNQLVASLNCLTYVHPIC